MGVTAPRLAPWTLHNMTIASRSCSFSGTHANFGISNREQHRTMNNQDSDQAVTPIDAEEVTAALTAILTTDKFAASPQMSAFLKYVVEQTMIGNTRRIKAFTVGIEALGKPASFDPQTDPSVRVLAKRLRSSLDTYYAQNPDTTVFIEMKPGCYVPKFLLRSEMKQSASDFNTPNYQNINSHTPATPTSYTSSAAPATRDEAPATQADELESDRQTGISQLWQAYKSASKVA